MFKFLSLRPPPAQTPSNILKDGGYSGPLDILKPIYEQVKQHLYDTGAHMSKLVEAYTKATTLDWTKCLYGTDMTFAGSTDPILHRIHVLKLKNARFVPSLGNIIYNAMLLESTLHTEKKERSLLARWYEPYTLEEIRSFETLTTILRCLREYSAKAPTFCYKLSAGNKENLSHCLQLLLHVMKGAILLESLFYAEGVRDIDIQEGCSHFQLMYKCLKIEESHSGEEARIEATLPTHEDTPTSSSNSSASVPIKHVKSTVASLLPPIYADEDND